VTGASDALLLCLSLPGDYARHANDLCPNPQCREPRFEQVQSASGIMYKPRKVFWHLGLGNAIRDRFFGDKMWSRLRGCGREAPLQYYSSKEAERLNAAVGGKLFKADNSAYDIGFDSGQVYINRNWSTGVIAIRRVWVTLCTSVCAHDAMPLCTHCLSLSACM
jgi:hypothetical protein